LVERKPVVTVDAPAGPEQRFKKSAKGKAAEEQDFHGDTAPMSAEWMIGPQPPNAGPLPDDRVLACTQDAIRRCIAANGGVILGRAGAMVLRSHPTALHVRLDGDPERRVRQAATLLGISEEQARDALGRNDHARAAYVRHFYRTDAARPEHYHLVLDSTRMSPEVCTDLIVAAATSPHRRQAVG